MMDIKQFTALVDRTMTKSGTLSVHAQNLSKPAASLISQYGPLTDKISKDHAVEKAIELWEAKKGDRAFVTAVDQIGTKVASLGGVVVNGSVMSLGALQFLKDNFASTMNTVLTGVKPEESKLAGVLLAAMDAGITAGLAFVPVVGPFLVPLSQGLGSALTFGINQGIQSGVGNPGLLFNTGNAAQSAAQSTAVSSGLVNKDQTAAATTAGKSVGTTVTSALGAFDKDSALGQLAAQKGIASLVVKGISLLVAKNEEDVLKKCAAKDTPFIVMMQAQTQNQSVASGINDLARNTGLELPEALRSGSDRTKYYLDEKKTLKDFQKKTNEMYKQYYTFIEQIINLGVIGAFAEPLSRMQGLTMSSGAPLKDTHKIALLLLGYYHAKLWAGGSRPKKLDIERTALTQQKDEESRLQGKLTVFQGRANALATSTDQTAPFELQQTQTAINKLNLNLTAVTGRVQAKQQLVSMLESKEQAMSSVKQFWSNSTNQTTYRSAFTAYQQTTTALSKKDFLTAGDGAPDISAMVSRAQTYFDGLKSALVSDITSGMSNATLTLDEDEMVKMWKLYIGANLIVNQALRDGALKTESKLKRLTTFLTPKTASTLAEEHYVKLIDDAGFIRRHSSNTLNDKEKKAMALERKIRWRTNITSSPSDAERAMLIAFCIVVAFSLDVGKISLGFVSWEKTKDALGELCLEISQSRYV